MTDAEPWHSLTEAARLTGLDREAIRSRARRGHLPSRRNNRGEMLVQVPPDLLTGLTDAEPGQSQPVTDAATDTVADLLAEIAELVRTAQITALRELADRLTAELVAARRPWWRRLWSG